MADIGWETDYRKFVAPGAEYSTGAHTFDLLRRFGLQAEHSLVDVGCGSLRVGRFLVTYLEPGRYFALEPNKWLVDAACKHEVGTLLAVKGAQFAYRDDFDIAAAFPEQKFDWVLFSSILVHLGHQQMADALHKACAVLAEGGRIVLDLHTNGPDYQGNGWLYPGISPHYPWCLSEALPPGYQFMQMTKNGIREWFIVEKRS